MPNFNIGLTFKSRYRLIYKAVGEEFRRSILYKAMSILTVLGSIANFLSLFDTKIAPKIPIPSLSWRSWFIVTLSIIVLALVLVIEAVYRFHHRMVGKLYANHLKIAQRILRLSDVGGYASRIDRDCDGKEDEVPHAVFKDLVGLLQNALSDSDFTSWHPEILKVPEPPKRHVWFQCLRERVSDEVSLQIQLIEQAKKEHEKLGS